MGFIHLLIGLWAVRECRRRAKLIRDPDLLALLTSTQAAMGERRNVELRELTELTSPAVAGWLRPMILLPDEWRSWPHRDLQAVLAHELAHIQRSDYLVGLVARAATALHFYHPVVHWLAARLLIQQEHAADALGARFAGGEKAYLAALSRMALRQDRRVSWWPARAFSPARGTLIRRIRMLQVQDQPAEGKWSAARRVLTVVSLSSLALFAWTLPSPLRGADKEKAPVGAKETGAFDLSYLPEDAMGVLAIRPAAIFRCQGMAPYAVQLNALKAMDGLDAELGVPLSKTLLRIEQIEQVTVGVYLGRRTDKNKTYKDLRTLMAHGLMIRTLEPFDWSGELRRLWPGLTEVHEGGKTYYTVKYPKLSPEPCFYVPDNRTLVGDEGHVIRKLLRRAAPSQPGWAQHDDWKEVEPDLVAVTFDNHDGRIRQATMRSDELDKGDLFAEAMQQTDRWVFGLANSDDFLFRTVAACRDSESARKIEFLLSDLCKNTARDLEKPDKDSIPDHLREQKLVAQMLKGFRIEATGSTVRIEPKAGVKLAELLPLLAKTGL
jgi:hypothetical protein